MPTLEKKNVGHLVGDLSGSHHALNARVVILGNARVGHFPEASCPVCLDAAVSRWLHQLEREGRLGGGRR